MPTTTKPKPLEALHVVLLGIDARKAKGTPRDKEAKELADFAVEEWKRQFWKSSKQCPHCGRKMYK